MKKILLFILLAVSIFFILSGCAKTYQKDIDKIYVYHSAFGQRFPEYKIDLKNKQLWGYTSDFSNYAERDDSLENEGFTFLKDLEDEKIDTFLRESARYGMTRWNELYIDENVLDGHQWGITIIFSDSTQQLISGSNKYPKTWDKMLDVFEELTDVNILIYTSDWK